jgi:hypothetical protein
LMVNEHRAKGNNRNRDRLVKGILVRNNLILAFTVSENFPPSDTVSRRTRHH